MNGPDGEPDPDWLEDVEPETPDDPGPMDDAPPRVTQVREPDPAVPPINYRDRVVDGETFILGMPAEPEWVWGRGSSGLWAKGEPFILGGPTGVGKTTLAGQVAVRGRLGLQHDALGLPITPDERPVLYLAMDRPRQTARSLARQFGADEAEHLRDRLLVRPGPPPADAGKHPGVLLDMAIALRAGTVVIDSLKDLAVKLTDDEVGGNVNRAMQYLVAEGIEVIALHHQRKGTNGNRPNTLEDVYGSTWITAGAGSVALLWGSAGDPLVDLVHLKQPADVVGPWKVEHHIDGTTTLYEAFDPVAFLRNRPQGATAADAARAALGSNPSPNDQKKHKRQLDRLVANGLARCTEAVKGGPGGSQAARYYLAEVAP